MPLATVSAPLALHDTPAFVHLSTIGVGLSSIFDCT